MYVDWTGRFMFGGVAFGVLFLSERHEVRGERSVWYSSILSGQSGSESTGT
jgi:hypothetical protein